MKTSPIKCTIKVQRPGLTATDWLHGHHVFCACQRQLHYFQDGFAHFLQRLDTHGEGQEKHVEPGDEEAHWPAQEPQDEEPQNTPQEAGTQLSPPGPFTASFTGTHGLVQRQYWLLGKTRKMLLNPRVDASICG